MKIGRKTKKGTDFSKIFLVLKLNKNFINNIKKIKKNNFLKNIKI